MDDASESEPSTSAPSVTIVTFVGLTTGTPQRSSTRALIVVMVCPSATIGSVVTSVAISAGWPVT